MKRFFFITDAGGSRRLDEADFPLSVGGAGADIALPDVTTKTVLAHIALADSHAYIQPANETTELFHNHEHVGASTWLKSGDRVQLGEQVLCWDVKGDQVFIKVRNDTDEPELLRPVTPPPVTSTETDDEIIPIARITTSPGKTRRLRYLIIVLFCLLMLIALYVLFSTSMTIVVSPEPDEQSVSGFPPPISLGNKMLVVPGTFTLQASRRGYQPLEQRFEVPAGGFQSFNFELQELPGQLHIMLDPVVPFRALIAGDEAAVETGNIVLLERGKQQLSIETDRYLVEDRELEITGYGEVQELGIVLRPAWASVELDSIPDGANVTVDEEVIGTTPLAAEILQGQHGFEVSLPGFKTTRLNELFTAGTSIVIDTVNLVPNDGTLRLESNPNGATVTIDGNFQGSTPVTIVLASGTPHQIRLSKPGYQTSTNNMTLKADEEQRLLVDLPPVFGIVFTTSHPADAALSMDGKLAGSGTQRLRLTTRPHQLTFSKPGYMPQTVNVTPNADTSQNIEVTLKTLVQAKEEARPTVLQSAGGQEMHLLEPAGSFQMGASRREAGRRANESQRLVEITKPFYLGSREVTNAEYRVFDSKHQSGSAEGVSLNDDKHPVVNISWHDAARYCNWLSRKDKLPPAYGEKDGQMALLATINTGYRLPTEAEWVYAARVAERNAQARYPWGEGYPPTAAVGNFADAQISDTLANVVAGYNDGYRGPAPVGSFSAQSPGFHDLGGNVAEWINDFYAVYPGQAEKLVRDPIGPASGDHHVVRGSSWRDGSITELRLSYRDYSRGPRDNLGFRIARYADE